MGMVPSPLVQQEDHLPPKLKKGQTLSQGQACHDDPAVRILSTAYIYI